MAQAGLAVGVITDDDLLARAGVGERLAHLADIERTEIDPISTRLNLAVVIDEHHHVVGLVSEAELLQRVTPELRETSHLHRFPFSHPTPVDEELRRRVHAGTAAELMTTNFVTAKSTQRLNEVIESILGGTHKIVVVTDEQDRLIGVVNRADVTRRLLRL